MWAGVSRSFSRRRARKRGVGRQRLYISRTSSGIGTYETCVTSCSIIACGKIGAKASGPTGSIVAGFKGGSSWKGRSGTRLYQLSGMAFSSMINFVCCISHLRYAALRDQTPAYSFSHGQVFIVQETRAGTSPPKRSCPGWGGAPASWPRPWRRQHWSGAQVLVEEGCYLRVGVETVLQFGQTVALVLVEQVIDRTTVLFHALDDLLGLPNGHAWVVLAVDDHERGRYLLCLVDGAYGLEERAILLQRGVLGLAQGATVAACVLQEGDEVGDPHDVHSCAPELRVFGEGCEHHEPAVGATHYRDTPVAALPQPVRRVCQVLDGVHPQPHVVEVGVSLAVSCGPSNVRKKDGEAPAEEVLRHRGERGS